MSSEGNPKQTARKVLFILITQNNGNRFNSSLPVNEPCDDFLQFFLRVDFSRLLQAHSSLRADCALIKP